MTTFNGLNNAVRSVALCGKHSEARNHFLCTAVRNTKETRWQTKIKGTKKAEPVVAKMAVSPAAVNPAAADKTVVKEAVAAIAQGANSRLHSGLGRFGTRPSLDANTGSLEFKLSVVSFASGNLKVEL
jgi:hypothetical protein